MINKITDSQLQSLLSYYVGNTNEPNAELLVSALCELIEARVQAALQEEAQS